MIAEARRQESSETVTLSLRQKVLQIIWDFKNNDHTHRIRKLHPKLIEEFPEVLNIDELVGSFHKLFSHKRRNGLRKWLIKYGDEESSHIRTFIQGIKQDIKAVSQSTVQHWSNGPVEGQVNRLKTIKRMIYGRAGFDLLRNRFLYQL